MKRNLGLGLMIFCFRWKVQLQNIDEFKREIEIKVDRVYVLKKSIYYISVLL